MRAYQVAKDIDLDAASSDGAAIDFEAEDSPFTPGYTVIVAIHITTFAETEAVVVVTLQGREVDTDVWADLVVADSNDPAVFVEAKLPRYLRYEVQAPTSLGDGRASIHLLGN
jgi:hypothetical protein